MQSLPDRSTHHRRGPCDQIAPTLVAMKPAYSSGSSVRSLQSCSRPRSERATSLSTPGSRSAAKAARICSRRTRASSGLSPGAAPRSGSRHFAQTLIALEQRFPDALWVPLGGQVGAGVKNLASTSQIGTNRPRLIAFRIVSRRDQQSGAEEKNHRVSERAPPFAASSPKEDDRCDRNRDREVLRSNHCRCAEQCAGKQPGRLAISSDWPRIASTRGQSSVAGQWLRHHIPWYFEEGRVDRHRKGRDQPARGLARRRPIR